MRVQIDKLVYGGDGLARTDQGVMFVPRTAPGDVVEVEILERKKDYAMARVRQLLEPSPDRQPPFCANYESAGCCHWQHIRYARQLDFKEEILRETLWRVGRIEWKQEIRRVTGPDRADRMRATFHIHRGRLGFMKERSHEVIPITECSALAPALNAFIEEGNRMLAESPGLAVAEEVRAVAGDDGSVAASVHSSSFSRPLGANTPVRFQIGEFTFELHPDAFFQPNRFLASAFLDLVLEESGESLETVGDLYCGAGFFSIPLARRCRKVIGVDNNEVAIQQAHRNAELNGVSNVEFIEHDAEGLGNPDSRPDLLLLDPPRAGCGVRVIEDVAAWKSPRVVYVSCNPSTFAREAALLMKHGYALESLTLVDQFPNTYHIESVARFALSEAAAG